VHGLLRYAVAQGLEVMGWSAPIQREHTISKQLRKETRYEEAH
jgi:hypothetical protein